MNINEKGQFTWARLKRIPESEFAGREDYALKPGDVLFNNTNSKELVGKTCLIEDSIHDEDPAFGNQTHQGHQTDLGVNNEGGVRGRIDDT